MVLELPCNNHHNQNIQLHHDWKLNQGSVDVTHLSLSALFLMVLSWLIALLFSMDILAWFARISLLCLKIVRKLD